MNRKVIESISRYVEVTEELEEALAEAAFVREFSKGTVLLKEGEICSECYFILKGLIRSYYLKQGDEKNCNFYLEDQVVSPACYGKEEASPLYLECLEDTIACVGTPRMEQELFGKYPVLENMSRLMGEKLMSSYQERFDLFKLSSPEERYLHLIENDPELVQRVPLYQLASYLGIAPESLSRIRRRISGNK